VDDERISWEAVCGLGAPKRCWKGGSVDNFVLNAVSTRLGDVLDRLFLGRRRVTGEYMSSDNEFSSDEEEAEWLSEFMALAKQPIARWCIITLINSSGCLNAQNIHGFLRRPLS